MSSLSGLVGARVTHVESIGILQVKFGNAGLLEVYGPMRFTDQGADPVLFDPMTADSRDAEAFHLVDRSVRRAHIDDSSTLVLDLDGLLLEVPPGGPFDAYGIGVVKDNVYVVCTMGGGLSEFALRPPP